MKYTVNLERPERAFRSIEVVATSPAKARQRALALARGDIEPNPDEDAGEWCDSRLGRAFVRSVVSR